MEGERPDPDEEYWDREYPDPEEVEELASLPDTEGPATSGGLRIPGVLKITAAFMAFAMLGSILLSTLGPLGRGGGRTETPSSTTAQEAEAYQRWIATQVSAALAKSGMAGQARFLGVQFDGSDGSIEQPIVGILAEGAGSQDTIASAALQSSSIATLQRLFADERAQSVTLAWFRPASNSESSQADLDFILAVGMLRGTAEDIDWKRLASEDLRTVADLYQEA